MLFGTFENESIQQPEPLNT